MAIEQSPEQVPEKKQPEETTSTESIVRQHMEDPNHIITEQDMLNVEVGKFEKDPVYEGELSSDPDADELKDADEGTSREQAPPNPWMVKE